MSSVVLDASAFLALSFDEPGAERVLRALGEDAAISAVNLAEVVAKLLDKGFSEREALLETRKLRGLPHPLDRTLALATGLLRSSTRSLGLSLGDRACIALARELGLPVLTADRNWTRVDLGVEVELIR